MADPPVELTAAEARNRRMEVRQKKVLNSRGDIFSRALIGIDLLSVRGSRSADDESSSLDGRGSSDFYQNSSGQSTPGGSASGGSDDWSMSDPTDPFHAAALTATRAKFRRPQFRRLKGGKKGGKKGKKRNGGKDEEENGEGDEETSSDVSSETSSSDTSTSSDEDAVEAVVSAAATLLREEKKELTALTGGGVFPGPSLSDGMPSTPSSVPGSAPSLLSDPMTADAAGAGHSLPSAPPPSQCGWPKDGVGIQGDECPPNGVLSVCGRRREMEDAVALVPAFVTVPCTCSVGCLGVAKAVEGEKAGGNEHGQCQLHMFAVFDGHGGSQAAIFCSRYLARVLGEELRLALNDADVAGEAEVAASANAEDANLALMKAQWKKALTLCFARVDAEISGHCYLRRSNCNMSGECPHEPLAAETVGTTAVVTVLTHRHMIIGNCGDSRAILCRGGEVISLSKDHKPDREDEMKRIEKAGGRVIFWNGYRVLGVLAMSRAIGDRYLKPYVICEPEVYFYERTDEDECIVLASDGLWDVISNEVAADIARKCFETKKNQAGLSAVEGAAVASGPTDTAALGQSATPESEETPAGLAAAVLTRLALARGSSDNISVVVIDLRRESR